MVPLETLHGKDVLLTPDFNRYSSNAKYLGLRNDFDIPGLKIEKSFFSYKENIAQGESLDVRDTTPLLQYNILAQQGILNAFVVYLIPLLVILFSLFGKLVLTRAKIDIGIVYYYFSEMGTYTAFLFAIIILHSNLRTQFQTGSVLYIEYLFFITYVIILMLVIYSLILARANDSKMDAVTKVIYTVFWPILFFLGYIVTMIVFY